MEKKFHTGICGGYPTQGNRAREVFCGHRKDNFNAKKDGQEKSASEDV